MRNLLLAEADGYRTRTLGVAIPIQNDLHTIGHSFSKILKKEFYSEKRHMDFCTLPSKAESVQAEVIVFG